MPGWSTIVCDTMVSARMTEIDELLREFPPGVREHLRQAWDRMPEAARGP